MRRGQGVRLDVDRLEGAEARELAQVIRGELERLCGSGAWPGAGGLHGGRLDLGDLSITVPAGASLDEIGAEVARMIWTAGLEAARKED